MKKFLILVTCCLFIPVLSAEDMLPEKDVPPAGICTGTNGMLNTNISNPSIVLLDVYRARVETLERELKLAREPRVPGIGLFAGVVSLVFFGVFLVLCLCQRKKTIPVLKRFLEYFEKNGSRTVYTLITCTVLLFLGTFFWHCANLILEPRTGQAGSNVVAQVTQLRNNNQSPGVGGLVVSGGNANEAWGSTYDLFDKHFTTLLGVLGFFGLLFGVIIPAGAYLLQRQSLKEERENMLKDAQRMFDQTQKAVQRLDTKIQGAVNGIEEKTTAKITMLDEKINTAAENLKNTKAIETEIQELKNKVEESSGEASTSAEMARISALFSQGYYSKEQPIRESIFTQVINGFEVLLLEAGKREKKSRFFEEIYSVAKADCASAYNNRGLAKYTQGNNIGALDDYSKAIDLDPKRELFRGNRIEVLHKLINDANTPPDKRSHYVMLEEKDQSVIGNPA